MIAVECGRTHQRRPVAVPDHRIDGRSTSCDARIPTSGPAGARHERPIAFGGIGIAHRHRRMSLVVDLPEQPRHPVVGPRSYTTVVLGVMGMVETVLLSGLVM